MIKIAVYPYPVDVSYNIVRTLLPKLLSCQHSGTSDQTEPRKSTEVAAEKVLAEPDSFNFDIVVHLGLAQSRKYYSFETCAHRDGYSKEDITGESFENDTYWRDAYGAPAILRPSFDTQDVWNRWQREVPAEDVRTSHDAGRYLCEFMFFTSMLEQWRKENGRICSIFCHLPPGSGAADLERGKRVVLALIAAVVRSKTGSEEGGLR